MCQRWLRECFLNVLDLPEIINYIALTILFGIDYQVYFVIALLRFSERAILQAARRGELIVFLNGGGGRPPKKVAHMSGFASAAQDCLKEINEDANNHGGSIGTCGNSASGDKNDSIAVTLGGFRTSEHMRWMLSLQDKHRDFAFAELLSRVKGKNK